MTTNGVDQGGEDFIRGEGVFQLIILISTEVEGGCWIDGRMTVWTYRISDFCE